LRDELSHLKKVINTRNKNKGTNKGMRAEAKLKKLQKRGREAQADWFLATLSRQIDTPHGMRERLEQFWADHFTVVGKNALNRFLVTPYVEEAIRPNITGRFADLLRAATLHPVMMAYLDQDVSVGPNSRFAKKRPGLGLNENLAREILELHTLGVGAQYAQRDVREFAELMTGLAYSPEKGVRVLPKRAEPGPETILGTSYGSRIPNLAPIHSALDDIAARPETAAHIARKLAVHFVSDTPDPDLVSHIAAAFRESDGDLMACYTAMLEHPAAWHSIAEKVKQPFAFVTTGLRALDIPSEGLKSLRTHSVRDAFVQPLKMMGQPWQSAVGPDGWSEEASAWITPQGMAMRIQWAMTVPMALSRELGESLPDPETFGVTALGENWPSALRFAASSAQTKWEGVGIVLASPAFQRR
jgi:uncharacterized protein (DUF1800 family)